MKKKIYLPIVLRSILVLLMAFVLLNGHVWAQDPEDAAALSIKPPLEFRAFQDMNPEMVQLGRLNAMDKKGASIDGVRRAFSASVSLMTWDAKPMKRREFVSGIPVGFMVDSSGEIIALWNLRPEMMPLP